jgi:nicotinamidase/pyrazinamidase
VVIPNRACDLAGAMGTGDAQQIVVEKQTVDAFAVPNLSRILDRLAADRYVIYGVVTEICVLYAARGLLKTGKPVVVVTDAIEGLKAEDSERALEQIRAAGGTLATVGQAIRT